MTDVTENTIQSPTKTPGLPDQNSPRPKVYEYTDYRKFLVDSLADIKARNPSYSESAFIRQAGLGANSRGYLRLIVSGKRNLSYKTIMGFARCLKLSEAETTYFENLVYFNQATSDKDKSTYFERLSKAIKGKETSAYELLRSQYHYFTQWYLIAIRELISFPDFSESGDWIGKKLRGRVTKTQIEEAIADLINLGLVKRNEQGQLEQSDEIVQFSDNSLNHTVINNLHQQFLEMAKKSLEEDRYEDRSLSYVVLACDVDCFDDLRQDISEFRAHILAKYGQQGKMSNAVLNMAVNLFHITPPETNTKSKGNR